MQLASKGLGFGLSANVRTAPSHIASGVRSLHVHVPRSGVQPAPPAAGRSLSTTAGRVLQTTRAAFTHFFSHLTTPGFSHPVAGSARSLSTRVNAAVRPPTIQQGFSLTTRHVLSQPRPPFLPRPSPASRSTVHVGLGTARNFSTARPLFQHLVQNVPVAGRAIYEANWHVERNKMKDKAKRDLKAKENVHSGSLLKPTEKVSLSATKELDRYFPAPAPGVTTILLAPLVPTPTSRLPLSDAPSSVEPSLLVLSNLQDILSSHRMHSLRISSLFTRLDASCVWEKGAKFTAYGDASGLCTVLRVEFQGWTETMVKDVIGEAGGGWCRLVEIRENESEEESDVESGMSSFVPSRSLSPEVDPAHSVVLPMVDLSASFLAAGAASRPRSPAMSTPPSPVLSASELSYAPSDLDVFSYSDSASDTGSWSDT